MSIVGGIFHFLFGGKDEGLTLSAMSDSQLLKAIATATKKGLSIATRSNLIQEALKRGLKIPKG